MQSAIIGSQAADRVGFFLQVDDFDAAYEHHDVVGVVSDGTG